MSLATIPLAAAAAAVLLLLASRVADAQPSNRWPYIIGLWGDMPYNDQQALVGVPNLIRDMNAHNLMFSVFDGDWKAGNAINGSVTPTLCNDALYDQSLNYLNSLRMAAVYTPGDNEWTDCDRARNGGYNSRNRLDLIRKIFFANEMSQGRRKLKMHTNIQDSSNHHTEAARSVRIFPGSFQLSIACMAYRQIVQQDAMCLNEAGALVPCVENRRWQYNGVTYITLNIPGSCNNLCDTNPDPAEFAARNAANIKWMRDGFAAAVASGSVAVMIISQADPGWDLADGTRAPLRDPKTLNQTDGQPDGFYEFLTALRDQVIAFDKPIAYVTGDSHYFRIDTPLLDARGRRINHFTRVETPGNNAQNGNNDVSWVKVTVTPTSREVFQYALMVVPGNEN